MLVPPRVSITEEELVGEEAIFSDSSGSCTNACHRHNRPQPIGKQGCVWAELGRYPCSEQLPCRSGLTDDKALLMTHRGSVDIGSVKQMNGQQLLGMAVLAPAS